MKITETVHVASVTGKGFITFIVTFKWSKKAIRAVAELQEITAANGESWGNEKELAEWEAAGKVTFCPWSKEDIEDARYIAVMKARERIGYVA